MTHSGPSARAGEFCARSGLRIPILLAPMAGACPPGLSIAVANAGGMGAMGTLISTREKIRGWVEEFRSHSSGPFQLNTWVPDPPPPRNHEAEEKIRGFLERWGPSVPASAGDAMPPDFNSQCETFLELAPTAVSSIMGIFPRDFIRELKKRGIAWFATATTLREARIVAEAGADAIIAQGFEAGGHRGSFDAAAAEREGVGLVALVLYRRLYRTGLLLRAPCRRHRITGDCSGWNRRRAGRRSCLDPWSECRNARHSLSALPRSADAPGMG